jgi:hypothetical protein
MDATKRFNIVAVLVFVGFVMYVFAMALITGSK